MGNTHACFDCFDSADYVIFIKTGDTKGAGLHNSAHIILINENDEESRKIELSGCSVTVFKKGRTDKFNVKRLSEFGDIKKVIIEQHKEQNDVDWYIEKITVRRVSGDSLDPEKVFPVHRWLRMSKPLVINEFDSCLPQHDLNEDQRKDELTLKKIIYAYRKTENLPPKMCKIPRQEVFSNFYKWEILQKRVSLFQIYDISICEKAESWRSFDDIITLFTERNKKFRMPAILEEGFDTWRLDSHFGRQRLRGCNPKSIKLCKSIPENFNIDEDSINEHLEDFSLSEAIDSNRLFIINHSILDGIIDQDANQIIPSPMALFYLNNSDELLPVCIQLYQQINENNPVFTPSDPHYTWLAVKMWFNNADATVQRMLLMASSHWILECITLAMHRNVSPSHPIHRLMQPYLRLVLAINCYEMHPLLTGHCSSWIENNTTIKSDGMIRLIEKFWEQYDFEEDGLKKDLENRGVLDAEVIAMYPYRDDALNLHKNIEDYIRNIVEGYYVDEETLVMDYEIQSWAADLTAENSCGIKNTPGNGEFARKDDLINFLTHVIFKVTVEHASLNLPLYDECAFVPNYPLCMRGLPPQNKDPLTEADVMAMLPSKNCTMEILIINKLISERDSSGLADSRAQYQFDPVSLPARERFQGQLRETAAIIDIRNRKREEMFYDYLNPKPSIRLQHPL